MEKVAACGLKCSGDTRFEEGKIAAKESMERLAAVLWR